MGLNYFHERVNCKRGYRTREQGVVLIVALVFLVSLTAVASTLMLNSTSDIKMSGAAEVKLVATQEAISAVDETVSDQITAGTNLFTRQTFPIPVTTVGSVNVTSVNITNRNFNNSLPHCTHERLASSVDDIRCNILSVDVQNNYGKRDASVVNISSGITQQVLNVGN